MKQILLLTEYDKRKVQDRDKGLEITWRTYGWLYKSRYNPAYATYNGKFINKLIKFRKMCLCYIPETELKRIAGSSIPIHITNKTDKTDCSDEYYDLIIERVENGYVYVDRIDKEPPKPRASDYSAPIIRVRDDDHPERITGNNNTTETNQTQTKYGDEIPF